MLVNIETARTLIIERSRQLVEKMIKKRGHDTPPFLAEEFANLLGIMRIEKVDLGRTSGILIRIPGDPIIKVNQSHIKARQNFSCAHEIAHNLLRDLEIELDTENISYRTFDPQAQGRTISTVRERLCDVAAAELLMPEVIFRKYLLNFGISINSVRQLAELFRVSVHTAAIRFSEVSPEPCIAFFWRQQKNKPNSLQLDRPKKKLFQKTAGTIVHQRVTSSSAIYKAYEHDDSFKCYKLFKVDNQTKKIALESKRFGYGEFRYVLSLAYPDR